MKKEKRLTTKRCNEMIDELELSIKTKFQVEDDSHKYPKKMRQDLIKVMKENPSHCWWVGENGLKHGDVESTILNVITR